MDDQLKTTSTSPDSILSEFSSHDSGINTATAPPMSTMSVLSPLRSSITLANMSNVANSLDDHHFFSDNYSSRRTADVTWWQSDIESLNFQLNEQSSPPPSYLITDFRTNQNVTSSSITDVLVSPMSHMSTSSSTMSFSSISNQAPTNQRSFRPTMKNSTNSLSIPNKNSHSMSSAQYLLPLPTPLSSRQTLASVDNIPSILNDNDLQRVPPSFRSISSSATFGNGPLLQSQPQPQVIHTANRSNPMPSWRGYLPMRFEPMTMDQYQINTHFSQKVFLGGIPPELTEAELLLVLRKFGKCNIKWPKNDGLTHNMPGFCHVVFRESRSVCELLKHCTRQQRSTIDYFLHIHMSLTSSSTTTTMTTAAGGPSSASSGLSLRPNRLKPIQVVPWNMKDNVFVVQQENISTNDASYKDWSRTIFVSPLHGKMTAFSLATIMANVFGSVSMAQINTDKYGYPTGTGTVLFCDSHSYMRAVAAGAIDIKCDCFHKLLDIDPFLRENEPCAFCPSVADLFCRNFHCLRSYCKQCWVNRHGSKPLADHQPATRRQQPLPQI
ncbi:unnamed protein product [Adineta ricciae]|uniref:RRM domain-containing protein n=1 Tax=Adineta ricciae TaxID=249248 RepID=A0A815ZWY7_ADIRI|nr:unnamed protein product [Adineta ricciae]